MLRCRRQPLLTSDDMRHPHQVVINNVGKVVRRIAIRLHQYLVVDGIVVEFDFSVDEIPKLSDTFWNEHPDYVWLAVANPILNLLLAESMTQPVILCLRVLMPPLLRAHLFQSFGGAKAVVGVAGGQQEVDELVVNRQSLGLFVGSERTVEEF